MEDSFIGLQAILAGLPIHAVPPAFSEYSADNIFVQCSGRRPQRGKGETSEQQLQESRWLARIEERLDVLWEDYPDFRDILDRLEVEHVSLDMVILVDRDEQRMFTSARGTDRALNPLTFPRDWANNARVLVGMDTARATVLIDAYRSAREKYPDFKSFGSGHSLGGAIMVNLAKVSEDDPLLTFSRIDTFNTAVSPLTRSIGSLSITAFHAHRVSGDWASWGMSLSPQAATVAVHVHPQKPHLPELHALGHFLPNKAGEELSLSSEQPAPAQADAVAVRKPRFDISFLSIMSCLGKREKLPREGALPCEPAPVATLALPQQCLSPVGSDFFLVKRPPMAPQPASEPQEPAPEPQEPAPEPEAEVK